MGSAKIAISLDEKMLRLLDDLVSRSEYASRSGAIQIAVGEMLQRKLGNRLARECNRLDPEEEMAIAEEGMNNEIDSWPEY